ncbi:MAG: hypothetical protein GF317_24335 [Candidatus Lokiarchaeota archaeon]|nr:hypothetical protein [Candidatus Lokiarchaeota archaeon]MBD3202503.1 hypothetical protein [Candidatus Lokiarchaeota archaeon]
MNERIEKSFNVGIVGENQDILKLIGQSFGAPGTRSDLQFYNRLDEGIGYTFCAITPLDYPNKIKPLLQTLEMTDIYILVIDLNIGLNSAIGELLIAIEVFNRLYNKGVIITLSNIQNNEWKVDSISNKLDKILKTTSLVQINIINLRDKADYQILKEKVVELGLELIEHQKLEENNTYTKILIDHIFPVKGIGTVALSIVKRGTLKKGQLLELVGFNGASKKVLIKNIQKHDRDFNIAYENDRVGLALKGVKHTDVSRYNLIATQNIFRSESVINADLFLSELYIPKKGKISSDTEKEFHLIVNLGISPVKFLETEEISPGKSGKVKVSLKKPLFHDGSGISGILIDMNKFEGKNRIVGTLTQI